MLQGVKHIHFIGVGGYGMSALAFQALSKGLTVTGSDLKRNNLVQKLEPLGLKFFLGHNEGNLVDLQIDMVIFSTAIKMDNPELHYLRTKGVPSLSRGEALGLFCAGKKTIAIAGTHGKTTTTSMISHILTHARFSPTVLVGGEMLLEDSNAIAGDSEWLVTEADESDASFLFLKPYISIVTNIEEDHMDFYKNKAEIIRNFEKYIFSTSDLSVLNFDDPAIFEKFSSLGKRVSFFSVKSEDADWFAGEIEFHEFSSSFRLFYQHAPVGQVNLIIPGQHNIQNALAAISATSKAGVSLPVIIEALSTFKGVARRIQLLADRNGIRVFDDYAHHPTEIKTVLTTLRKSYPAENLIAVFQPHRFSRFTYFQKQFPDALLPADQIVVTGIYGAGEKNTENISSEILIPILVEHGKTAIYSQNVEQQIFDFHHRLKRGDVIVALGAGSITYFATKLAELVNGSN
ncbi:MAG: UDP-N-acetylmuramate--L-alanine ligase [Candidatus Wallbacteria bacterium]|nr:UDP-N-acetylmuramate--L-alanine ligase [Candidatus Wallbacteria bacterium]